MGSAQHPWRLPALLAACFAAGIVWSMIPALPGIVGAALAAAPIAVTAIAVRRSARS